MLPEGWRTALLDDVTHRRSGHTPDKKKPEYWNGGVKWVSLADSSKLDNGLIDKTDKEISADGIANSSAVLLPKGTPILSRDAGVGKSAILGDEMAVSQHFIAWVCGEKKQLEPWYLYNWLQVQKPLFERMAVGSTIKTIGLPFFKRLKINLPPLPEQQKIAEILSTWDQAIEATQALLDNAKRQKRALMQQLLSGKRRFPEFQGQEWEDVRLGDLLNGKKRKGKIVQTNEDGEGVPYIGASSFDGVFDIYTIDNNLVQCNKDDLLVLWDGENAGMATVGLKGAVSSTVVRYRLDLAQVNPTFICELMALRNSQIRSVREGSGIPHMPKDFDTWFRFSLPSKAEQDAIAEMLQQASENVKAQAMLIKQLTDEKRALMQQLLTGKRRVMVDA